MCPLWQQVPQLSELEWQICVIGRRTRELFLMESASASRYEKQFLRRARDVTLLVDANLLQGATSAAVTVTAAGNFTPYSVRAFQLD